MRVVRYSVLVCVVVALTAASGPADILLPLGFVATLFLGGIGYGVTKNKADTAHQRIDALDTRVPWISPVASCPVSPDANLH